MTADLATTSRCRPIRRERETTEIADMVRRVARSMARRAERGDIEALEFLVQLQRDLDTYIDQAARGLHGEPGSYSWGEIGRWLGITRQAARQRFGGPAVPVDAERQAAGPYHPGDRY